MISIIVPFCDKDYNLLPQKILQLENIYLNEELIFVDDRRDKSVQVDVKGHKYCSTEGGAGPLYARYCGFKISTQEYIYFSDIDDEMLFVYPNFNSDINIFNVVVDSQYYTTLQNKKVKIKNTHDIEKNLITPGALILWQTVFKRHILKKFYKKFEIPKTTQINEDNYQVYACLSMAKTLEYNLQVISNYKSQIDKYTDSSYKKSYKYWFEKLDDKAQRLVLYSVAKDTLGL